MLAEFGRNDATGTIEIGGVVFECYLGDMEAYLVAGPLSGRQFDGKMRLDNPKIKHKFTLVEL